jgi:hypothetical protein
MTRCLARCRRYGAHATAHPQSIASVAEQLPPDGGALRIYECLPLISPRCGEAMRIVAFIQEPEVIERILRHIGAAVSRPNRRQERVIVSHIPWFESCTVKYLCSSPAANR